MRALLTSRGAVGLHALALAPAPRTMTVPEVEQELAIVRARIAKTEERETSFRTHMAGRGIPMQQTGSANLAALRLREAALAAALPLLAPTEEVDTHAAAHRPEGA